MTGRQTRVWRVVAGATCARPRIALVALLFTLAGLWAAALWRADGPLIDSDLLGLVAASGEGSARSIAEAQMRKLAERRLTFMVTHAERDRARGAAQALEQRLLAGDVFRRDAGLPAGKVIAALALYDRYPFQLADDAALALTTSGAAAGPAVIEADKLVGLVDRAERSLLSGAFSLPGVDLRRDPFLLLAAFHRQLAAVPSPFSIDGGHLTARLDGDWTYLVPLTLTGGAFDFAYQDTFTDFTGEVSRGVAAEFGVGIGSVGAIDFAIANRALALREVGIIGTASLALIAVLLLVTFRHPRPLLAVAFTIACGVLAGFAATLAAFGSVHLLTLVGGSSLIGIAVDYAFHLLADAFRTPPSPGGWRLEEGLSTVLPAVSLGLATSLLGFFGLFASGFSGMMQIAVFSASGLLAAFLCLPFAYPALLGRWRPAAIDPLRGPLGLRLARRWGRLWRFRSPGWLVLAMGGAALLLLMWRGVHTDHDVRLLAAQAPEIDALVQRGSLLTTALLDSRFILVEGPDAETVLQREEVLRPHLVGLEEAGDIAYFSQFSRFVPSARRQREVLALNQALFLEPGTAIETLAERIGLSDDAVAANRAALASITAPAALTVEDWLASPLAPLGRHLWLGPVADGRASIVTLAGVANPTGVRAAVAGLAGVTFVDRVAELSQVFGLYVDHALVGLFVALTLIAVLLIRVFGWAEGLGALLVPVGACALTLAVLAGIGVPINLFHIVGLALVLGIGLDYTLFLKFGRSMPQTILAVLLAAVTTECAFGLLGLSRVGAINSFGVTVALGVAFAFLLAPMSAAPRADS